MHKKMLGPAGKDIKTVIITILCMFKKLRQKYLKDPNFCR